MPTAIPFSIDGFYTNEPGLYIDPADSLTLQSGGECCMKLTLPCGFTNSYEELKIENVDGPCVFSWCKIQSALTSMAASNLLAANGTGDISPVLTAAQIACATANALLTNCNA